MDKSTEDNIGIDPSIFGYRWKSAEQKHMIFFSSDDIEVLSTSAAVSLRERPSKTSPQSMFESLSLEVLHLTIEYLDLGSLVALRSVNFFMSEVVRSLPAFRDLTKYAPQVLKALSRTRLIRQYGIMQLYDAFRSSRCSYCNHYGPYIYLLQCKRCCYPCIRWNERLVSIPQNKAKRLLKSFGLAQDLPRLLTLPGTYAYENKLWKKRLWLVSFDDVRSTVENSRNGARVLRYDHEDLSLNQIRFYCHAVVALPSVSQIGDQIIKQHGLWCRGCEDNHYFLRHQANYEEKWQLYTAQEMAYSDVEFAEHCRRCSGIKRLKDLNYPNFESIPEHRRCVQRD